MYSRPDVDNLLASMRSIKVVATKPAAPAANTMYYVGPDSESNYHVYLYDALLNEIDLGMAMNQLYREGTAIDIDSANTINVKIDDDTIKTNLSNELYVPELMGSEGSGINPIYLADNKLKASTSTVGHSVKPVYLNSGELKTVNTLDAPGIVHTNVTLPAIPFVRNDGVIDVGGIIDFHSLSSGAITSGEDYVARLQGTTWQATNTSRLRVDGGDASGFIPVTGNNASVGST